MFLHASAMLVVLGVVAAITPAPGSTDRGFYERMGREVLIRDCADIHCFRPLVAAVLEHLPGPSLPKWKAYAVIANAIGALAVGRFCLLLGLSSPAAIAAMWLSALGTGSLYSLFDSYTSDPLMYMLGPIVAVRLLQNQLGRAGWIAAVAVFAKEFAAAPLWIFTLAAALARRWPSAARLLLVSGAVTLVWLAKQAALMALLNYRYGFTASVDLLHGAYFRSWIDRVGPAGALMYLFTTFGGMYLLLPIGFMRSSPRLRTLALASVPAALAFLYVEQPERGLWNFHFIVIPIAVAALQELPASVIAMFVAACGVVGLRFGAQLDTRTPARVALIVAIAIAVVASFVALRGGVVAKGSRAADAGQAGAGPEMSLRRFWWLAALEGAVLALLTLTLVDVHAHRRDEAAFGVNQWGFRGPIQSAAHPGLRIAWLGGDAAFGGRTEWRNTVPALVAEQINARRGRTINGDRQPFANVDNLAEPQAGADSYAATLRDYEYLRPDVVCIYDGYAAVDEAHRPFARRRSFVFRAIGYLPDGSRALPAAAPWPESGASDVSCSGASASYCVAMTETVRYAIQRGRAVVVATPPYASARHEAQQRSLAEQLDREFGRVSRFRYVNLGRVVDLGDRAQSDDGVTPSPIAARRLASELAARILDLMKNDEATSNNERRAR